jgi:ribosomal protein L40E
MLRFVLAALLFVVFTGSAAPASAKVTVSGSLLVFELPVDANAPAVQVASNWAFEGCWQPNTNTPCADVFRDTQGQLWICKACGTTGKPTAGKCRRTSQAELDRGLWCS